MSKEEYLKQIEKFKISKNSKKLFIEQVNLFYEYNNPDYLKYKLGDSVRLSKNNLIHG